MARVSPFAFKVLVACCFMFAVFTFHWFGQTNGQSTPGEGTVTPTIPKEQFNSIQNNAPPLITKEEITQLKAVMHAKSSVVNKQSTPEPSADRGPVRTVTSLQIPESAQSANLRNRFVSKQQKQWWNYVSNSEPLKAHVFSDVCYEWSAPSDAFIYRHIFKTGEDELFHKDVGYKVGKGGRHSILDQGVVPVSADPSRWAYPATEGQDKLVLKLLNNKRNGFFVDLAARYWQRGSNSFALETYYDWQGICIEPDNNFARGLVLNRTCLVICNNPVTSKNSDKVQFNYKINNGVYSKGNEMGIKTTVTLQTVLTSANAPQQMDYLSLDVEDHELDVLRYFDFAKYQFRVLTVERPVRELHTLLNKHGYRWLTQLRGNFGETVYLHESVSDVAKWMNEYRPSASSSWRGGNYPYLKIPSWNVTRSAFD